MSNPIVSATASGLVAPPSTSAENKAAVQQAAREFEAILLREMLKTVKDCGKLGESASSSGQAIYGSMVVEAVANAVSQAGGLGMARLISGSVQLPGGGGAPDDNRPSHPVKIP